MNILNVNCRLRNEYAENNLHSNKHYLSSTRFEPNDLVNSVGRALRWYYRHHGFKSSTGLNLISGLITLVVFITAYIAFIYT